jgi:uncharacterized phage protein (TIGR02218 family)
MSGLPAAFDAHLQSGFTTVCRAWAITRRDGVTYGFTDHDCPLSFDGIEFRAHSGLTATALAQSTGLAVDNAEAIGALSDASITEADIEAGRFDGAEIRCWLVNWADPDQRWLQFRGTIGELRQSGGAFTAELRGLTDSLNQPLGRVYQRPCTAVLGDAQCRFALDTPGFSTIRSVEQIRDARILRWSDRMTFDPGWFARGRLDVLTGAAAGLWASIKRDEVTATGRHVELWEGMRAALAPGDQVRLTAGCDKRLDTCRSKFDNLMNYQGFPDVPGEDWLMAVPKSTGANTGGSRR